MVSAGCPRVPLQLELRVPAAEQVCQEVGDRRHPVSMHLTEQC